MRVGYGKTTIEEAWVLKEELFIRPIADSILGAAGLGSLERRFSEEKINCELLSKMTELVSDSLYLVENIDITVETELKIKEEDFLRLEKVFAEALGIEEDQMNLKTVHEYTGETIIHVQTALEKMINMSVEMSRESSCSSCQGCGKK